LSGTLYAINGDLQKIGDGIYLCTPKNIDVQGKITEENESQEDYME
jgi:cell division inhibitor SepF